MGLGWLFSHADQIIQAIFTLEAAILGLIGIIRGPAALKGYQESKARSALHSALTTALGLVDAINGKLDLRQTDKAVAYVQQSVPDAVTKLIGPIGTQATTGQIVRMLQSKAALLAAGVVKQETK